MLFDIARFLSIHYLMFDSKRRKPEFMILFLCKTILVLTLPNLFVHSSKIMTGLLQNILHTLQTSILLNIYGYIWSRNYENNMLIFLRWGGDETVKEALAEALREIWEKCFRVSFGICLVELLQLLRQKDGIPDTKFLYSPTCIHVYVYHSKCANQTNSRSAFCAL